MPKNESNGWIIFITLGIAIILEIMPIPEWGLLYRPQWLPMVIIFWCINAPFRMNIFKVWALGLLLDVLLGTLLGQHGIGFILITLISLKIHLRLVLLPLFQQSLLIFCLLVIERMPAFWLMGMMQTPPPLLSYWITPLIGAIIWPWLFVILRDIQRYFKVH